MNIFLKHLDLHNGKMKNKNYWLKKYNSNLLKVINI